MALESRLIIGFGYLGKAVAQLWTSDRGEPVRIFATTRRVERFDELRNCGVEPIQWDVLQGGPGELPEVETAVYCVGHDRSLGVPMREIYVEGLRRTLERLTTPGKLIYVSSTGVYGDLEGDWIDEDSPTEPIDESGKACLEAEHTLWEICDQRKLDAVVLRLAGIYGPGRMIGAESLRQGKSIASNPEAHVNLIHVQDATAVVEAARLRAKAGATYLVSDGHPVLRRDFYHYLANLLHAPEPVFDPSAARRHRGDRKVRNDRMMVELAPKLTYPDYRAGLAACFGSPQSG